MAAKSLPEGKGEAFILFTFTAGAEQVHISWILSDQSSKAKTTVTLNSLQLLSFIYIHKQQKGIIDLRIELNKQTVPDPWKTQRPILY